MMWWLTMLTRDAGPNPTVRVDAPTEKEALQIAANYFFAALPWKWEARVRTGKSNCEVRWKPEGRAA